MTCFDHFVHRCVIPGRRHDRVVLGPKMARVFVCRRVWHYCVRRRPALAVSGLLLRVSCSEFSVCVFSRCCYGIATVCNKQRCLIGLDFCTLRTRAMHGLLNLVSFKPSCIFIHSCCLIAVDMAHKLLLSSVLVFFSAADQLPAGLVVAGVYMVRSVCMYVSRVAC